MAKQNNKTTGNEIGKILDINKIKLPDDIRKVRERTNILSCMNKKELISLVQSYSQLSKHFSIKGIDDINKILSTLKIDYSREQMVYIVLNRDYVVLDAFIIAQGTAVKTEACIPQALKRILKTDHAEHVIAMHNHPSSNVKPSKDDIAATKSLICSFAGAGLNLIDHVIFNQSNGYSFKQSRPKLFERTLSALAKAIK
ncbi:MAG TPA: JAB domain-containing protein [Clostridiales bacterium]|nr:JAB domain-containing protein [Clostridiales bacterium]HQP69148.1 JAB domain-containing protein [Clostridiales bacterium]